MTDTDHDDRSLAALLAEAGAPADAEAAHGLLAGLAAAPETGTAGDAALWLPLVALRPTPALAERLTGLLAGLRRSASPVADRTDTPRRLAALRAELARHGLDGFVVPRADEHQGEYVPRAAQRLAWLTGFTGSAGTAVVLADRAALFVDGRYTIQVRQQVDEALIAPQHSAETPPARWIEANLPAGATLGYDAWFHTEAEIARLAEACERAGAELVPVEHNPVDAVWLDRPTAPLAPVVPHDIGHAGRSAAEKRRDIAADLVADKVDAAVLTAPDSIAWLLNIRGGDVAHTPLPLSFALLHADGTVDLFIDRRKLSPGLETHFGNGVRVRAPGELEQALDELSDRGARVRLDPAGAPARIFERLRNGSAHLVRAADPCLLPKARKNDVELAGTRAAHRRDAAAMVRFLAWLAERAPAGGLSEIAAADRLLAFRREHPLFRDLSFGTISGAGPNGAIVHYSATPETDRLLEEGMLYLVDSGAQYPDGTTDVTRTVAIGAPEPDARDSFTRVLKGHIAIATARFPKGTTGGQLDVLARIALWQAGRDFDHGTGHGVGSYLGVHEGPQRISKAGGGTALEPGMILSNEPGCYKAGAWGIRIENLVAVRHCPHIAEPERETFDFEVLTLVPIDRTLVDPSLLSPGEIAWLDAYHARVRDEVSPLVAPDVKRWLDAATAPLARG